MKIEESDGVIVKEFCCETFVFLVKHSENSVLGLENSGFFQEFYDEKKLKKL